MSSASSDFVASSEAARLELMKCEQEIARVKSVLRELGPPPPPPSSSSSSTATTSSPSSGGGGGVASEASTSASAAAAAAAATTTSTAESSSSTASNSLTIQWVSTEGLPEGVELTKLVLQLSSPVEEATLLPPSSSASSTSAQPKEERVNEEEEEVDVDVDVETPTTTSTSTTASYTFRGVETGQATLTITGFIGNNGDDATATASSTKDLSLSTSLHDLAPLLKFDALQVPDESSSSSSSAALTVQTTLIAKLRKVTTATKTETASKSTTESLHSPSDDKDKQEGGGGGQDNEVEADEQDPAGEDKGSEAKEDVHKSTSDDDDAVGGGDGGTDDDVDVDFGCTVTLSLTFVPSHKDRREELYEVLNRATQRKAMAVEQLRTAATAEHKRQLLQQQQQTGDGGSSPSKTTMVMRSGGAGGPGPAVRAGFLNKPSKKAEDESLLSNRIKLFYEKHFGPNSLVRQIFPLVRNYIVFAAAVSLMHFKGQMLALPPPV